MKSSNKYKIPKEIYHHDQSKNRKNLLAKGCLGIDYIGGQDCQVEHKKLVQEISISDPINSGSKEINFKERANSFSATVTNIVWSPNIGLGEKKQKIFAIIKKAGAVVCK